MTLTVGNALLAELNRWREQQLSTEEQLGGKYVCTYSDGDGRIVRKSKLLPCAGERIHFVCLKPKGNLLLRSPIAAMLKVEGLNAHSFHHTHTTQLILQTNS